MMIRKLLLLSGIVTVAFVYADDPPVTETAPKKAAAPIKREREQPMSVWMERKLEYSQTIFKALAMGDLDTVKFNASQMNLIGKVEGFARMKNKPYQAQLHTFDRISYELTQQADKDNIEGATLAFNQLTVNCVQCHQLLRDDADGQD